MTVSELIKKLSSFPSDMEVMTYDYNHEWLPINNVFKGKIGDGVTDVVLLKEGLD